MTVNFTKGIGRLTTDRYDFAKHLNGSDFRHKASQLDVDNPAAIYGSPSTVEQALENIGGFITVQEGSGIGYITVPDGYDTYHAQNGTINFDTTVPSLDTFLNPIFTAIINNTAFPDGYTNFERIRHGGIIFIKSGTYIVKNTITLPPGIILLGEGYGTKIINATSIDTSVLPPTPKLVSTAAPIFSILADANRAANDGAIDPNQFIFQRNTQIIDMVLSDNFVEPTVLGDTYYKLPQNKTSSTVFDPPALISQQLGSNLHIENVMMTGRVNFSSGLIVSQVTGSLIALDNSSTDTETFCEIDKCFIDGFAIPFYLFNSTGSQDYLDIKNSKIRSYGYYNGDSTTDGYNCFIKAHTQNVNLCDSILYGNASNITSLLHFTDPGSTPNIQNRSKIVISNNQVSIEKSSNLTNSTWKPIYFESSFTSNPNLVLSALIFGNSFQDTFDIYVDAGNAFAAPGIGSPLISVTGTSVSVNTNTFFAVNGLCDLNGNVNISQVATVQGNSAGLIVEAGADFTINNTAISNITSGSNSTIIMESGSIFDGYAGSYINLDGYIRHTVYSTNTNYTCDTSASPTVDFFVGVDTTTSSNTIYLPTAIGNRGRMIIVKDIAGNASVNIIYVRAQAGQYIDLGSAYVGISTNFGAYVLISNNVGWYVAAKY